MILIPARGGSKGLPRKNARALGGLQLLGWSAEAVRCAGLSVGPCLLSTDDEEIAAIGKQVGLEVPFLRPAELATDSTPVGAVAVHALDWLETERGFNAKTVMLLQPTSPFRNPDHLGQAVRMLDDFGLDAVVGVKPIHRTSATLFSADQSMNLSSLDLQAEVVARRQDVRTLYTPSGTLYLIRSQVLREHGHFLPPCLRGIVSNAIESIDIDSSEDWEMAQAVAAAGLTWRG